MKPSANSQEHDLYTIENCGELELFKNVAFI